MVRLRGNNVIFSDHSKVRAEINPSNVGIIDHNTTTHRRCLNSSESRRRLTVLYQVVFPSYGIRWMGSISASRICLIIRITHVALKKICFLSQTQKGLIKSLEVGAHESLSFPKYHLPRRFWLSASFGDHWVMHQLWICKPKLRLLPI